MEWILNLLYFYIAAYTLFFLAMSVKNLNDKLLRIQQRYSGTGTTNNLCIIIYSHNDEVHLENLVKQLKNQDYPSGSFSTYIILDNCSDNSEKLFVNNNFAQIINIKDQGTIGKDQALSILLEKLSAVQNCNAYVFLDSNRYIEQDFLQSINAALTDASVISGSTILLCDEPKLRQKIKMVFHKYYTNFILKARSLMGLAVTIDSDILIMRQDLVEKIGCIDFQNINSELKYSLLLSKIGCKCTFNPNIKTYMNVNEFDLRIPSLSTRLSLFKNCFTQIWSRNFVFNEHVMSLLTPNVLLLVFAYGYLLKYSYKYYFIVDFSIVLISFALLILGFAISLLNSKLQAKEIFYLFLYPFYSMGHIFKNFPLCRKIRNTIKQRKSSAENGEKLTVDVSVTDGKNNIACKLELISENGLAKVKFMFKNKTFATSTHLRMFDAITELTKKLEEYGFVLKICQCCTNFSSNIDGSTNMVKGFCNYKFSNSSGEQIPTLLWNSCRGFNQNKGANFIEEILQ
ncbi:MAG: glycosyltransferase family 2 protein [Candidatus Gastranaerophilales bacterium]|nr:glycosyltransferase family 2 protein [Candidatus Gastranaerophilales bacterium]